jgi:opacity protein-like surface antigen
MPERYFFMSVSESRFLAISEITSTPPVEVDMPKPLSEIWACDVFNLSTMEECLSKNAFKAMKNTVQTGAPLGAATADVVAAAMKDWAMKKGAKFFSHIFYPMTNATAEKHDGFIVTNADGNAITEFTGSLLIKGEPDGSSFPNGSLRMTNAARGYTAWDPTSPAYIMHTANGATLMIPSVFMSWTGEALDKKIPLLRSNAAMNSAAQKVLALMGETDIATLNSSCGAEQEYFLIDDSSSAYKVMFGYNLGLVPLIDLAVEADYRDFGSFKNSDGTLETDLTAFDIYGLAGFDVGPIGLFAKLGYSNAEGDFKYDNGKFDESDSDVTYGLGAKFQLGSFAIRAEYESFEFEGSDDLYMFSAGAVYTF